MYKKLLIVTPNKSTIRFSSTVEVCYASSYGKSEERQGLRPHAPPPPWIVLGCAKLFQCAPCTERGIFADEELHESRSRASSWRCR